MWFLSWIFSPPEMPRIALPMHLEKVSGIMTTITEAFRLAYYRGVLDGFLFGAVLVLLFSTRVGWPARRQE